MLWQVGPWTQRLLLPALLSLAAATPAVLELELGASYSFNDFVQEFDKAYADDNEFAFREQVFQSNLKEIMEHNSAGHSYRKAVNALADLTKAEFKQALLGYKPGKNYHVRQRRYANSTTNGARPSVVDWREKGALTEVKDQGMCGSCWTFGSTESLESELFLETGQLLTLSEQAYVSCTANPSHCGGTGGCGGGTIDLVYEYAERHGMFLESDLPYTATEGDSCPLADHEPVALLQDYVDLPENDLEATLSAVAERPIPVNLDASAFSFYSSGVFDETHCGTDINHVVQLVGYTEEYYIIRNSWGPSWGEGGFMRIKMSKACATDTRPSDGTGCDGGPSEVTVCGSCGILYQNAYPKGIKLTARGEAMLRYPEVATAVM